MQTVALIELSKDFEQNLLGNPALCQVPRMEDKVVFDIDNIGYIFEVVEVHYGDEGRVEVFVKRVSATNDYWQDRKEKLLKQ